MPNLFRINISTLIRLFFIISFLSGFTIGQNSKLYSNNHSEIYPLYFNAIESAADGYFEEAILVFHKMLVFFPNHQEATLLLKICNDKLTKKISEDAAEYLFKGVNISANLGDSTEVEEYFNKAISEENNYFPFYLIRGIFYTNTKLYDRALSDFSTAIQLAPRVNISYYNRGKIFFLEKDLQKALKDFNTVLTLNPNFASAYVYHGKIYAESGDIEQALSDYQKAQSIDPRSIQSLENSAILNNIGAQYINRNDYDKALLALNAAIDADERWYEPYLNRGIVYRATKLFELALKDLEKAIQLKPQIGKIYYNRGLTYKEMREFQSAKKDLIRSLAFKDTNTRVYFTLAEVYSELKEYNKATNNYLQAIEVEPNNIWAYFQLGSLYDQRRGFKLAIKYYDEFLKHASNDYFKHKINIKDRVDKLKKYLKQQKNKLKMESGNI